MLVEAYRVLEEGGVAGFTVWGRKENSEFFTLMPEILASNGIMTPPAKHTNFHLNDIELLERDIKEAGFVNPKLFYAPNNKAFYNGEEVFDHQTSGPSLKKLFSELDAEIVAKIKADYIAEFDKRFGQDTTAPFTFEVIAAVAWK
mmetsp:Transcript_35172/g.40634  ORF Transcript_35172/g.40634 Transcript_35172/m.40634 type:complete len:145 (-) Transcript_35172:30-464(-)